MKLYVFLTTIVVSAFSFGCGSAPSNSAANAGANANTAVIKLDPANMPEGLKGEQIQPSANSTPGIPPTMTNLPKGATPTPGIPDPETLKKGLKPGVTPTPGIPSPEELRKAMGQPAPSSNTPPAATSDQMMKKNTNKIQKPQ